MKKIFNLMLMSMMLITLACSNDEDEYMISSKDLEQTTWKAMLSSYENSGDVYKTIYMLQFHTKADGTWIFLDDDRISPKTFSYIIDRKILIFDGFLDGEWTIMDSNKKRVVLQTYRPEKCVMVLEKQY